MPTTVRGLTAEDRAVLVPLLESIHDHMQGCEQCKASAPPEGMCDVGRGLYRRWEQWLTGRPPF